MKTSQGFLDIANFAKLISVISVICLVFSIMPKVSICMSTISSVPCIATLEVCHGSTEGIQKSIDTPFVHESTYLSASIHYVGGSTASSFTPSPLLIVFQDYPPPKSAS